MEDNDNFHSQAVPAESKALETYCTGTWRGPSIGLYALLNGRISHLLRIESFPSMLQPSTSLTELYFWTYRSHSSDGRDMMPYSPVEIHRRFGGTCSSIYRIEDFVNE
jgi:hypothetical protein